MQSGFTEEQRRAGRLVSQAKREALSQEISELDPAVRARVESAPANVRGLLLRSITGKAGPKSAIKAFCQSCMGYDDYRDGVRNCTARACALYAHRPYQAK